MTRKRARLPVLDHHSLLALYSENIPGILKLMNDEPSFTKDQMATLKARVFALVPSTNAREWVSNQHIEDAQAANTGAQKDHTRRVCLNCTNDRCVLPQRMGLHNCQRLFCDFGGDNGEQFALVGNGKRIKA